MKALSALTPVEPVTAPELIIQARTFERKRVLFIIRPGLRGARAILSKRGIWI